MKTEVFLNLLEDPKGVQKIGVDELRELALAYPYSQVIQLLYGIRLRYSSEHLFNQQLGRAAALSNDRSVLFELFEDKPKVQARASSSAKLEIKESETKPKSPKPKEETIQSGLSTAVDAIADKTEAKKKEPFAREEVNEARPKEAEPKPKVVYLDAKPDGMENLSPQDRVKAILERNRQLRQQFDDQKANAPSAEKLFSAPSDKAQADVESEESKLESPDSDKTELNKTASSAQEVNHPEEIAAPEEDQIDKVEKPSGEAQVDESDQVNPPDETTEAKSSYEDHPIDISDLIRRRYRSRFETPAFQDEEEPVSEEAPAATADDAPIESSSSASEEDESDMGMSVRIRDIRARLERLKNEDALSEEEMEALMEEHQKLEELLSLLPAEDDHVFEVEVSQEEESTEDTSSESEKILDSQEQEAQRENDHEPVAENDSSSEDSEADRVKEEEAAEPKAEEEREVEEEKTEVEEDKAPETEEKSQSQEPKPAADTSATEKKKLVTDEKEKVESPSSESEPEPTVADEISRIEALAERLRFERQGKTMSERRFSTRADDRKEPEETTPKAEDKPAIETPESNEVESDLASQDEVGTSADTGAEGEKETEQESADKEEIKGSSIEEEAADLVQALEEDIASVEEDSSEVSGAIDEKEDLIESTSEDAQNIEGSSLEQDAEEAQAEAKNEAEVEQEVEESSVESPNLSKDSEDQEETTEPQAEEEKTDTESDAAPEAVDQEKLRTEPVQEDTAETVAKDESKAAEEESAEEDDDSPTFGTLLKRLKSRGGANTSEEEGQSEKAEEKQAKTPILKSEIAEKIDLIDAFVEKLPDLKKRKPSKADIVNAPEVKKEEESASESEEVTLVTETLAKVYIKQGHFKKAIQAYEILRLKYPEKSSFFASRILEIKKLSNSKK